MSLKGALQCFYPNAMVKGRCVLEAVAGHLFKIAYR